MNPVRAHYTTAIVTANTVKIADKRLTLNIINLEI